MLINIEAPNVSTEDFLIKVEVSFAANNIFAELGSFGKR